MDITQTIFLIIFFIIDLIIIAKPFVGLLNIIFGFFTIIFTVLTINELTLFSLEFRNYFIVLMVFVGLITMIRGIEKYTKLVKIPA